MQVPTVPPSNQPHDPAIYYISQSQSPHPPPTHHHRQIPSLHRRSFSSPPHRIMPSDDDIEKGGSGECDGKPKTTTLRRRSQSFQEPKKFPPAMPILAWNGNGNVQMPWVLKRSYTDNGHLVIHEVQARHHDFFRVNRTGGRLTLHLMHMDETPPSPPPASQELTTVEEMLDLNSHEKEEKRRKESQKQLAPPCPIA